MTGLWTAQTSEGKEVGGFYVIDGCIESKPHMIVTPDGHWHKIKPDTLQSLDMAEMEAKVKELEGKCEFKNEVNRKLGLQYINLQARLTLYDEMKAENQKLNLLLFHTENGLSHPDLQGDIDKSKMCGLCEDMVTALNRYGQHELNCVTLIDHKSKVTCDCGLYEVLDKATKPNEKETNL